MPYHTIPYHNHSKLHCTTIHHSMLCRTTLNYPGLHKTHPSGSLIQSAVTIIPFGRWWPSSRLMVPGGNLRSISSSNSAWPGPATVWKGFVFPPHPAQNSHQRQQLWWIKNVVHHDKYPRLNCCGWKKYNKQKTNRSGNLLYRWNWHCCKMDYFFLNALQS